MPSSAECQPTSPRPPTAPPQTPTHRVPPPPTPLEKLRILLTSSLPTLCTNRKALMPTPCPQFPSGVLSLPILLSVPPPPSDDLPVIRFSPLPSSSPPSSPSPSDSVVDDALPPPPGRCLRVAGGGPPPGATARGNPHGYEDVGLCLGRAEETLCRSLGLFRARPVYPRGGRGGFRGRNSSQSEAKRNSSSKTLPPPQKRQRQHLLLSV
mmetsp:Transcript_53157/g.104060  ORF Transcript_53157/g.104060 Transcript_53157/m.104060 type:complete len:209 (-) Transcript_53157:483-1109(-)